MPKDYQFDPKTVFPRVALYIRKSGSTYITHPELAKLLESDEIIRLEYQRMRKGGYECTLEYITPKMVAYFSKCWKDNVGYDMIPYREEFIRKKIARAYAYRVK